MGNYRQATTKVPLGLCLYRYDVDALLQRSNIGFFIQE